MPHLEDWGRHRLSVIYQVSHARLEVQFRRSVRQAIEIVAISCLHVSLVGQALVVVAARHLLHAARERAERPCERRGERQPDERHEQAGDRDDLDRLAHRAAELPLETRVAHLVDHRQPMAAPVLEVRHHDLEWRCAACSPRRSGRQRTAPRRSRSWCPISRTGAAIGCR